MNRLSAAIARNPAAVCLVAGAALALLTACASRPAAVAVTTSGSETAAMAAGASHCSRGCPQGAPGANEEVRHTFYTLSNNPTTKFADWVAYIVDPELTGGPDRPRNWKADPQLAEEVTLEPDDYDNISQVGMDRGHQAPLEAFTRPRTGVKRTTSPTSRRRILR